MRRKSKFIVFDILIVVAVLLFPLLIINKANSAGNYSHTSRATGATLTASIYNSDHVNHITNATPAGLDDYSSNVAQMQATTDPYPASTESLASSTAGDAGHGAS